MTMIVVMRETIDGGVDGDDNDGDANSGSGGDCGENNDYGDQ